MLFVRSHQLLRSIRTVSEVLSSYVQLWSERNPVLRGELVERCWAENGQIISVGQSLTGRPAVLREVERFQQQQPGHKLSVTSNFDIQGEWARFSFAQSGPGGELISEGTDVVEFAEDGRIALVVTFWGRLSESSNQ